MLCGALWPIDLILQVRPWTFFEDGLVGHIGMADPFDKMLAETIHKAISKPGVLKGEGVDVHSGNTVICIGTFPFYSPRRMMELQLIISIIEGPQFSTRSESILYRSFPTDPLISMINMSTVPEYKLFREAEIAYALICMSTDYDSWHSTNEGVSVEMVMGHMVANRANAKRAVAAVLEELSKEGNQDVVMAERWQGASRGGVMGLNKTDGKGAEAIERLNWLFGEVWVQGSGGGGH